MMNTFQRVSLCAIIAFVGVLDARSEVVAYWDGDQGYTAAAPGWQNTNLVSTTLGARDVSSHAWSGKGSTDTTFGTVGSPAAPDNSLSWQIKDGESQTFSVQNVSGADLNLNSIHFDYAHIFGALTVNLTYDSGDLDDADGAALGTFVTSGQVASVSDWEDADVDLSSGLTDHILADGETATFRFDFQGGTAGLDNLAIDAGSNVIETEVVAPTISPNGGTHLNSVRVTLASATAGAALYYTMDGSSPDTNSTLYAAPFTLTTNATVNVIGTKTGLTPSSVVSADFVLEMDTGVSSVFLDVPFSGSAVGSITETELNAGTIGGTWSVVQAAESEILGATPVEGLLAGWDFEQAANSDRVYPAFWSDAVDSAEFGVKDSTANSGKGSSDGTWGSITDDVVPGNTLVNAMKFLSGAITTHDLTLTIADGNAIELDSLNFDMLRPSWSKAVHDVTVTILSSPLDGVANGTQLVSFTDSTNLFRDVDVDMTGLSDRLLVAGESITLRFTVTSSKADPYYIDNAALFGSTEEIGDRALSARTGPFDLRLNLNSPWVNDGKSFLRMSFKLAAHNFNNGETFYISGLDASSNTFFTVTYDNNRTMGALDSGGTYFPAGNSFDDRVAGLTAYDPEKLKTVTVDLKADALDLHVDGSDNQLSNFAYQFAEPSGLAALVLSGESGTEVFIDDIQLERMQAVAETGPLSEFSGLWKTSPDGVQIVERQADVAFQPGAGSSSLFVDIDTTERFQPIDGFGASMTDASAILIYNSPHRDEIMEQLFNPDTGIGMALVRLPMGACDFSDHVWSYEDVQGNFNIDYDLQMRIPLLKQALAMNPSLKLMGSPWSPPGWMKSDGTMQNGTLLPEYVDDYAQYFVNFVQAYEAEGLPIWAVTVQNEPDHGTAQYPSMKMTPAEHIALTKAIGAAFASNNISTKIIAFDHNYDIGEDYVNAVYADSESYDVLAGSAWHQYGGNASSMGNIWQAYPEKGVYFTERTGSKNPFNSNMHYFFNDIFFNALDNGARCVLTWNIAIDENGGPKLPSVTWNEAAGLVDYNTASDTWTLYPEYVAIGHYGRFVRPGAVRIDAVPSDSKLQTMAFKNVDGTIAVIVYNNTGSTATFDLNVGTQHLTSSLADRNAATFLFHELDDLDGNGLSDRWELNYFNDWGIDPDADADGDGVSNRSEYKAGTDPTDPENQLRISFIGPPQDGKIKVTPATRSDFRSWNIATSTNLIDWVQYEGVAVSKTSTSEIFDLPDSDSPAMFYRTHVTFP